MTVLVIILAVLFIILLMITRKIWDLYYKSNMASEKMSYELLHTIEIYDIWLRLTQDGYGIAQYLKRKNINSVALCRMTDLGVRLYRNLKTEGVTIACLIDCDNIKLPDVKYISIDDSCEESADLVIITDPFNYEELRNKLTDKGYENIDSIDGILYEILKYQAEEG